MGRFVCVRRVVGLIGFVAAAAACDDESQLSDGPDERIGSASAAICRNVELLATTTYNPLEQTPHFQLLDPAATFDLPQNLTVVQGGANLGDTAVFGFFGSLPDNVKCLYVADSSTNYTLDYCRYESGPTVSVTQVADATWVGIGGVNGDSSLGPTVVSVTLPELAPCDGVDCTQANVDDNNACTTDTCTPEEGIKHTPIEIEQDDDPSTIQVCFPATGVETRTAPALPGGTTTVVDAFSFLYTDPNPLQAGVGPNAIDTVRAALVEGYVFEPNGDPKPLANVSILGHPELGSTITDFGGRYLMVVNGGGPLTIDIQADGYLPAQRRAEPAWQGTARVDDVILVDPGLPDGSAELDSGLLQVITDTEESDDRGARRLKVLVQPETMASMELADGSLVPFDELDPPLDSLTLTIKEYTVGEEGPMRMPASLPPSSAYTYAVEIRSEEAEAAGATGVVLDTPLHVYLDNFLEFPVGTVVPVGRYDRQRGVWVPEEDGLVIGIVGISGGEALIDLDGIAETPMHETPTELAAVGFDQGTRLTLAEEYPSASALNPVPLWHVRLDHLSPCDLNWPPFYSPGACSPAECGEPPAPPQDDPDDCEASGSRIECSNQILGERFAIAGTPHSLAYSSDRVPGRARPQRHVLLPLTGATPPTGLRFVEAQVDVAGRTFKTELICPPAGCDPNKDWDFDDWDGSDLLGRKPQGAQRAVFTVTYGFDGEYASPELAGGAGAGILITPLYAFERWGGSFSLLGTSAPQVRITSRFDLDLVLGTFDARSEGLGGFTFDAVHHYDVLSGTLFLGDGSRRKNDSRGSAVVRKVADLVPATGAVLDLEAEEDGSLIVLTALDSGPHRYLYRYGRDGTITTLAGVPEAPWNCTENCLSNVDNLARGSDGTIYLPSRTTNLVYRLLPGGSIEPFAGNGTGPVHGDGDGGLATAAGVPVPSAVAVGTDGSVYIAQHFSRIRRVDVNGRIDTVATSSGMTPAPGAVTIPSLDGVRDMQVGIDGALYILGTISQFSGDARIWRIDRDGKVVVVAGGGQSQDDGVAATAAKLDLEAALWAFRFAVGPDGSIDLPVNRLVAAGQRSIRRITPDGYVYTMAGRPVSPSQDVLGLGGPAANAVFADVLGNLQALARTPDGRLFSSVNHGVFPFDGPVGLLAIEPALPGLSDLLTLAVASEDGREVYTFDPLGRHVQTIDTRFNNVILTIGRDSEGRIMTLTDENNRVTTVTRDGGDPTAITGPDGHVTNLIVNNDGYLETAEDPRGDAYHITYKPGGGGLMESWTNRNGRGTELTWDADGRLTAHENDAGGVMTLAEIPSASGTKVERTTHLLRKTTYERTESSAGVIERKSTSPSLLQATSTRTPGGETFTELPDGTEITTQLGGDPRFGMQAPLVTYQKVRLPSPLERVVVRSRSVTLDDPNNWSSLLTSTETTTICDPPLPVPPSTSCAGRTWRRDYDAVSHTEVVTSPELRSRTIKYDTAGRVTEVARLGDHTLYLDYDTLGRLKTTRHGPLAAGRITTREYDDGFLYSVTDPVMETVFGRNTRGDVTSETRAGNVLTSFGVDGEQQTTSVTPPGELPHGMTYGDFDKLASYQPPMLGGVTPTPTAYVYDLDKNIDYIDPPEAGLVDMIDFAYDPAGRLDTVTFPGGTVDRSYNPLTGQLRSVSGPYGVELLYGYDGRLLTQVRWKGDVEATVDMYPDSDFRLSLEKVEGGWPVTFGYDDDSLLTSAGTLTLARDAQTGRVTTATSGSVVESFGYVPNVPLGETLSYGELAWSSATHSGTPKLSFSYDLRDGIGRILEKTETLLGVTSVFKYQYDALGRLEYVRDGSNAVLEHYQYDDNGNRTLSTNSDGTFSAAFDEQDRIEFYGAVNFTFTPNGELESKDNTAKGAVTEYTYDALGNLIAVNLPNGTGIEYLVDGMGRRVGKKVDGVLEKQWLWRSQLQPVAELDGMGNVVARYIYGEGVNVPELIVTSTATYRLIKDHLGSARLVVDQDTGAVVQRFDYDSWGRILLKQVAPGFGEFQPFGFAGGFNDPHTGLVRFGARDYDPEIGRWTAKDPIRFDGGMNLYAYALSEPVNVWDPNGLGPIGKAIGQVIGGFIGGQIGKTLGGGSGVVAGLPAGPGAVATGVSGAIAGVAAGIAAGALIGGEVGDDIGDAIDNICGYRDPWVPPEEDPEDNDYCREVRKNCAILCANANDGDRTAPGWQPCYEACIGFSGC